MKQRQYNEAMKNPDSLIEKLILIVDKAGRTVDNVPIKIARRLVESGVYYVVTTGAISFT